MTYNKPEVVKVDSALSSIQGVQKPSTFVTDSNDPRHKLTISAYEADE